MTEEDEIVVLTRALAEIGDVQLDGGTDPLDTLHLIKAISARALIQAGWTPTPQDRPAPKFRIVR